ncbi:MAG: Bug family tripartite tricarboxylate transporter substrate binding protein [Solimonas sp.]
MKTVLTPRIRPVMLGVAALCTLGALAPALGLAQAFPSRPITLVVPLSAGGAADSLGRIWAEYASKQLGASVVVDNKAGANGAVGAAYVAKQPADGYTLLMATGSNMALNAFSYKTLPYKAADFDGVALMATTSQVVVANPASGIKSIGDLVKRARAKPNEVAYGSAGKGNSTHLNVEILARHYGLQMVHVPYKGAAPALMGVMGGETQFMCDAVTTATVQSHAGKVVPLAIFGPERIAALPGVPTAAELGIKDFVGGGWYGVAAPAGTPKAVIERLNAITNAMWSDPAAKAKLDAIYMTQLPDKGVGALKAYAERDAKLWGPLITKLGIRNED